MLDRWLKRYPDCEIRIIRTEGSHPSQPFPSYGVVLKVNGEIERWYSAKGVTLFEAFSLAKRKDDDR